MSEPENPLDVTSVEHEGRILSGVGTTPAALQETIDALAARAPESPPPVAPESREPAAPAASRASEASGVSPSPDVPPTASAAGAAEDADGEHVTFTRNDDGTFKKVPRGQKRFDQLTKARGEAERAAQVAREERDRYKAELEALRQAPSAAPTPTPPPPPAVPAPVPAATNGHGPMPVYDPARHETYEHFQVELARWAAEQVYSQQAQEIDARIRDRIEADRAARTLGETIAAITTRGRQAYPDFDAVLASATTPLSADVLQAIVEHPHSEHVQYQLAKDPARLARLAALRNPVQVGIELASLGPPAVASPPASTARAGIASPPAPYQPVGSGGKTTAIPLQELTDKFGDDFDASGYRERRRQELGRRR
jgi:hypothetical protein